MAKHPLKSRKFWLAVATAVTFLLHEYVGIEIEPEKLVAVILPIITYIVAQGLVDKEEMKK